MCVLVSIQTLRHIIWLHSMLASFHCMLVVLASFHYMLVVLALEYVVV